MKRTLQERVLASNRNDLVVDSSPSPCDERLSDDRRRGGIRRRLQSSGALDSTDDAPDEEPRRGGILERLEKAGDQPSAPR